MKSPRKSTSLAFTVRPVLLAAALSVGLPAHADLAPGRFQTEVDAVVAAATRYNPQSIREDREYLGAILHDGECYTYTVGAGKPGRDRVTVRIVIPAGNEVVAFWHTHGARRDSNRYFSDVDTQLVESSRKRFYLADHTGALKVLVPGAPTLSRYRARGLGLPARPGYSRGELVSDARGMPIRVK